LHVFNTMTREKEVVQPVGDPVTLYVCGVTPYDTTHLGHARTYLVFDVLQRYLMHLGHRVRYVQNVTDVDDPLFAKARQLGIDYRDLAAENVAIFQQDMADLNVLEPAVYPRVSEEVPGIIGTIAQLLDRGMAYQRNGTVYFRASKFPNFGRMSRFDRPRMLAADKETGENPDDPNKEDPLDFRLWHASQPDEPAWESPWGPGRPGWHIECSSMASRYLGNRIDFHGGGEDLIFPHHCSEIAQSESASGESPFVRYWMHVGLVRMAGEKMSKSLGNLAFVRDLNPKFGPDALRWYVLGFPYREQFEYFEHDLAAARKQWETVSSAARGAVGGAPTEEGDHLREAALAAMDDDLDTPAALGRIAELAALIERNQAPGERKELQDLLRILGFRLDGE
jgi:L-cysteine:1D-myo-inositol 2-amino-2-deoxy-alpha-D-glucopyranoside ligase